MFSRHVSRDLSAYAHEELAPAESSRVAAHLARCARCRAEFDEIQEGVALAQGLSRESAPEFLWEAIERQIEEPGRAPVAQPPGWKWRGVLLWSARVAVTFALLLVTLGVVAARFIWNPVVKLKIAAGAPSAFETAAYNLHLENVRGELTLEHRATTPHALRAWVRRHTGLEADIPDGQPLAEEGKHFQLRGAKVFQAAEVQGALITWTVDSRPVTLVTTRLSNVPESLSTRTLTSKEFSYRIYDGQGFKELRWARERQAYFMFTDLPEFGQQGCLFCHSDQMRRNRIRAMKLVHQ